MSRTRFAALGWVGLLLLAGAAGAQEGSPVALTVRGLTGSVIEAKPRRFLAVNVIVENTGSRDADGVIRVYRTEKPGQATPEQGLYYERTIDLPGGSRRVETVYYYCQSKEPSQRLCVAFEPAEGTGVPAPPPTFPQVTVSPDAIRVLTVSSRPAHEATAVLHQATVPGPRRPWQVEAAQAELSALPDHMAGYESFDAVVVTDLDADDLDEVQVEALLDWVAAGGEVIYSFSGRTRDLDRSPLRAVLPAARYPAGPETLERDVTALRDLARGATWPDRDEVLVARVLPREGAEVVCGDARGPLVVRGRHGAGWVTFLTFPIDCDPVRSWRGRSELAAGLLRVPAEPLTHEDVAAPAPPLEEVLLNLSVALQTLTPPSVLIVAPLLFLYVVLVSPVNFKLLSRGSPVRFVRGNAGLVQLAAVVTALLFAGGFYTIGRLYKGDEALGIQVALVELAAADGPSGVEVMTGYYSTDRGLVDAVAPPRAAVGPIAKQATSREGHVVQPVGGPARLERLTVDTWALRRFRTLRSERLGHVVADLEWVDGTIKGQVDNRTDLQLEDVVLLTAMGAIEMGRLAPRGVQRLPGNEPSPARGSLHLLRNTVADASEGWDQKFGDKVGTMAEAPFSSPEERILAGLRRRVECLPPAPGTLPALLVARVVRDPGGVDVDGDERTVLGRMLLTCELRIFVEPGPLVLNDLPPRVAAPRAGTGGWSAVADSTGSPPALESGEVEWQWRVPASREHPFTVDRLRLRWLLPRDLFYDWLELAVWNVSEGAWEDVGTVGDLEANSAGERVWPDPRDAKVDPADYVDPNTGMIRVQWENGAGSRVRVHRVRLDVAGTRG